eukprot:TRINITY_DN5779_c0_g1_i3.p1 TRINITY_DN5779_c0_g1~~TRINITY_DN5779_c0_g1_i3.p1  ORF type:complete len:152 (+),score=15.28 TRINITY_DN5779_c0_g1_i3:80-535(+)
MGITNSRQSAKKAQANRAKRKQNHLIFYIESVAHGFAYPSEAYSLPSLQSLKAAAHTWKPNQPRPNNLGYDVTSMTYGRGGMTTMFMMRRMASSLTCIVSELSEAVIASMHNIMSQNNMQVPLLGRYEYIRLFRKYACLVLCLDLILYILE